MSGTPDDTQVMGSKDGVSGVLEAELIRPGIQEQEGEGQNKRRRLGHDTSMLDPEGETIELGGLQAIWPVCASAPHGKAQEVETVQAEQPLYKSLRPKSIQGSDFSNCRLLWMLEDLHVQNELLGDGT